MTQLIARFRLDLSKLPGFLTAHDDSKSVKLYANIEGFDVNIELKSENSAGLTKAGDQTSRFFFNKAIIDINRMGGRRFINQLRFSPRTLTIFTYGISENCCRLP